MAAERFNAIEKVLTDLGGALKAAQDEVVNLRTERDQQIQRMVVLEEAHTDLSTKMNIYTQSVDGQKKQLIENINDEFSKHKAALQAVIEAARGEFEQSRAGMQHLYGESSSAFANVQTALNELKAEVDSGKSDHHGGDRGLKGFLSAKSMLPDKFGKTEDLWRRWSEDVADYADAIIPGMRAVLKLAEKDPENASEEKLAEWANGDPLKAKAAKEGKAFYRLLKALTEQEAHTVIQGVKGEDGFRAWQALHTRYGLSLAVKQAKAMSDVCALITKPAKNPKETRSLISELERRIQVAEEIGGRPLDDDHKKSILGNILDPTTKTHAAPKMGADTSYQVLKRFVLEFANNVQGISSGPDPDAMQLGRLDQQEDFRDYSGSECGYWEAPSVGNEQHLDALSPNAQCWKCHGYGHRADQCPTPVKGKGGKGSGMKGGGKGGKGKGADGDGKGGKPSGAKGGKGARGPMYGVCFKCNGAHGHHFASNCPLNQGKGGGGQPGFNMATENWPTLPQGQVRTLCAIKIANQPKAIKLQNRFQNLADEDEDDQGDKPNFEMKNPYFDDSYHYKNFCGCCALTGKGRTHRELPGSETQRGPIPRRRGAKNDVENKWHIKAGPIGGSLRPLATIEPEGLNPISKAAPEWEAIEMAVDSGASETVLPPDQLASIKLEEGPAKKRGVSYEVANGDQIPNLGERRFHGVTESGHVRGITAQVCDVNKPLLSVSKLVASGNRVIFDERGSYVEDISTGDRLWLTEQNGMYSLKLWVKTGF